MQFIHLGYASHMQFSLTLKYYIYLSINQTFGVNNIYIYLFILQYYCSHSNNTKLQHILYIFSDISVSQTFFSTELQTSGHPFLESSAPLIDREELLIELRRRSVHPASNALSPVTTEITHGNESHVQDNSWARPWKQWHGYTTTPGAKPLADTTHPCQPEQDASAMMHVSAAMREWPWHHIITIRMGGWTSWDCKWGGHRQTS